MDSRYQRLKILFASNNGTVYDGKIEQVLLNDKPLNFEKFHDFNFNNKNIKKCKISLVPSYYEGGDYGECTFNSGNYGVLISKDNYPILKTWGVNVSKFNGKDWARLQQKNGKPVAFQEEVYETSPISPRYHLLLKESIKRGKIGKKKQVAKLEKLV